MPRMRNQNYHTREETRQKSKYPDVRRKERKRYILMPEMESVGVIDNSRKKQ